MTGFSVPWERSRCPWRLLSWKPTMKISHVSQSLHPLAICLALVLGVPTLAQATDPAPVYVQNCLDHGAGSLRQAIIDGPNGAPIDLTHLTCGGIILTSGRIDVNRNLLIRGPGAALFSIDGARLDRVFNEAPRVLGNVRAARFRQSLDFVQCLAIDARREPHKACLSVIHLTTPSSLLSPMSAALTTDSNFSVGKH